MEIYKIKMQIYKFAHLKRLVKNKIINCHSQFYFYIYKAKKGQQNLHGRWITNLIHQQKCIRSWCKKTIIQSEKLFRKHYQ